MSEKRDLSKYTVEEILQAKAKGEKILEARLDAIRENKDKDNLTHYIPIGPIRNPKSKRFMISFKSQLILSSPKYRKANNKSDDDKDKKKKNDDDDDDDGEKKDSKKNKNEKKPGFMNMAFGLVTETDLKEKTTYKQSHYDVLIKYNKDFMEALDYVDKELSRVFQEIAKYKKGKFSVPKKYETHTFAQRTRNLTDEETKKRELNTLTLEVDDNDKVPLEHPIYRCRVEVDHKNGGKIHDTSFNQIRPIFFDLSKLNPNGSATEVKFNNGKTEEPITDKNAGDILTPYTLISGDILLKDASYTKSNGLSGQLSVYEGFIIRHKKMSTYSRTADAKTIQTFHESSTMFLSENPDDLKDDANAIRSTNDTYDDDGTEGSSTRIESKPRSRKNYDDSVDGSGDASGGLSLDDPSKYVEPPSNDIKITSVPTTSPKSQEKDKSEETPDDDKKAKKDKSKKEKSEKSEKSKKSKKSSDSDDSDESSSDDE